MKKSSKFFDKGFEEFLADCPANTNKEIMRKIFEGSIKGSVLKLADLFVDLLEALRTF